MKTAICFTGTGRAIDHTFWNLEDTVMNEKYVGDRDIFVYIANTPLAEKTKKLFEKVKGTHIHVVDEPEFDTTPYNWARGWPPRSRRSGDLHFGRNVYLNMIKSRRDMNTILDEHEAKTGTQYDRVIFSRMDVWYKSEKAPGKPGVPISEGSGLDGQGSPTPLVFTPFNDYIDGLDMNYLWLPHFHHWGGGYNDRFAIGNRENMRHYFSLFDHVEEYRKTSVKFQAEHLLKHHIDNTPAKDKVKITWLPILRILPDGLQRDCWDNHPVALDMPGAKRQRKLDYVGPGTSPHGKPIPTI